VLYTDCSSYCYSTCCKLLYLFAVIVNRLADHLRADYKESRLKPLQEEWPPGQPTLIVSIAWIHYSSRKTKQEYIEISKRFKEGASAIDKLASSNFKVSKNIHKIFAVDKDDPLFSGDNFCKQPKRILIEGAPGIGKTVLAKEIAYSWANGELLKDCELVFLVYLQDPRTHRVKSVSGLLQLFTFEEAPLPLEKYISETRGEKIALILDGFDEYPDFLQKDSFITNIILSRDKGKVFQQSVVVITSRPIASLFLHNSMDRRIEILGFAEEERDKYIAQSLSGFPGKKQALDRYLKQNPVINSYCFIPLYLAILLFLFEMGSLPETLTEMNQSFVVHTIYRHLNKAFPFGEHAVKTLKDLPNDVYDIFLGLCVLAFKGLESNCLVFSDDEIKEISPRIYDTPRAVNGFGLLQAVQHYSSIGAGRTTSFNFLHFTMQEYLAAYHVSTLPYEEQLELMKNNFWDGQYHRMWMMYVGIVGVNSDAFVSFISNKNSIGESNHQGTPVVSHDIQSDKIQCLHLFQCYLEARADKIPEVLFSMFDYGNINLTGVTLFPHDISTLLSFMSESTIQIWRTLELRNCNLRNIGMNALLKHVIRNALTVSTLEYVDLCENESPPWGVYCCIIKHCCVTRLTVCGDDGMEEYIKDIAINLEKNKILVSLTLCSIGRIGVESLTKVLVDNTTLVEVNLSWTNLGSEKVKEKEVLLHTVHTCNTILNNRAREESKHKTVDINILADNGSKNFSEPTVIDLSFQNITDAMVVVIAFGLCNNTAVRRLRILSDNEYFVCSSVKEFEVDDCEGISSPWEMYCNIIRLCSVYNITLCGDDGIEDYVKDIAESLESNNTIKSLTLCGFGKTGVRSIKEVLNNNTTLNEVNLSWTKASSTGNKVLLAGKFYCKSAMNSNKKAININILHHSHGEPKSKILDLSGRNISDDVAAHIAFGLYHNSILRKLDLSHNEISDAGAIEIGKSLVNNSVLTELYMSYNVISECGITYINDCLKCNDVVKWIDISCRFGKMLLSSYSFDNGEVSFMLYDQPYPWDMYCIFIKHCCGINLTLFGDNGMDEHVAEIIDSLELNRRVTSLTLCSIGQVGVESMKEILVSNTTLKEVNVSWKQISSIQNIDKKFILLHTKFLHENNTLHDGVGINGSNKVVNVNILYNDYHEYLPQIIDLSNRNINDDMVCIIAFGLCNNTVVEQLNISDNSISDVGAKAISECLTSNNLLRSLNISRNNITSIGLKMIGNAIKINQTLKQLNISYQSAPNLDFDGIGDCLKNNNTLSVFTISLPGTSGPLTIDKLNIMHVSGKNIGDSGASIISAMLYSDTTVVRLDISHNKISDNGVAAICECLKNNNTLQVLDISYNDITDVGIKKITKIFKFNFSLKKLYLSCNRISDVGAVEFGNCLQDNVTLEVLDISGNLITNNGAKVLFDTVQFNRTLKTLDIL